MRQTLVLLAVAGLVLVPASLALAHAEPAVVRPGLGASLTAPPAQVEITMTQELARREGANDIDVFDATGTEVTRGAAVIDNGDRRKISVPLPADLAPGQYTVRWKTLSAEDGDAATGEYVFVYDPSRPADPGREVLKNVPPGDGTAPTSGGDPPLLITTGEGGGASWITVIAAGIGGLVLGSGATFLLVQRKG